MKCKNIATCFALSQRSASGDSVIGKTARLWNVLIGLRLIDEAYRRLEFVNPLASECARFDLKCDRNRELLAQPNAYQIRSEILNARNEARASVR